MSGGQLAHPAGATGMPWFCFTHLSSSSRLIQACSHGNGRGTKESKSQITGPFQAFALLPDDMQWAEISQMGESYMAIVEKFGPFL